MKKLLAFLLVATMTVGLSACSDDSRQPGTAELPKPTNAEVTIEVPGHFFGTVGPTTRMEHTFVVRNTGSDPLIISRAKINCSCVETSFTKTPIKPGETGEVKVKVNAKKLNGGHFRKIITVFSNAKNSPSLLELTGDLITK